VNKVSAKPGLYIHVPFCKGKCRYCHFYSSTELHFIPSYLDALDTEMALYKDFPAINGGDTPQDRGRADGTQGIFDTIYFGGGTPSLLDISAFARILNSVARNFKISSDCEITVEVNPADQDPSWYKSLNALGVNRLNLGIQSFDDDILRFLGRRHTAAEAVAAIETAALAGFGNVGLDLIYGIPGQNLASWEKTLEKALSFKPAHLSCYELTIEENTPLARLHMENAFSLPNDDLQWDFFRTTSAYLTGHGYTHYEVSNFSRREALATS
jgi:oxygen-independent coproporphyrinogen III oxidase